MAVFPYKLPAPVARSNLLHDLPEVVVGLVMRSSAYDQQSYQLLLLALNVVPDVVVYLKGFVDVYYLFACLPVGRVPLHIDVVRR